MTNQELNKKLAEWAGFGWKNEQFIYSKEYAGKLLYTPDGECQGDSPPNFTESLDACFKWLVPKLDVNDKVIISWSPVKGYRDYTAEIIQWSEIGNHKHTRRTEHEAPALALCLAIEKLIGKEVLDGQ